ncbi:MAG: plastocyanin [Planctomycetota bacterium]|jgi:plastocyanin
MMRKTISVVILGLLAACGGKDEGPVYPEVAVSLPPQGETVTISGSTLFLGTPPRVRDIGVCQGDNLPIQDQSVRVKNGRLADVLIYVKEGLEAFTFPHDKTEVEIDQKGCVFRPHVLAVQVYQPIKIKNSDAIIHNVHFASALKDQSFVTTITPARGSIGHQVRKPEIGLTVTCDLHAYMLMYVHALPHPFFAVTKEDGSFEIKDLPTGSYVIEAVHQKFGRQTSKIDVVAGQVISPMTFSFKSK